MRPLLLPLVLVAVLAPRFSNAQCIADVFYLKDSPIPCNFVGTVNFDNNDCFDFTASPAWKYTWKIFDADDGGLVAQYPGLSFNHSFTKFGGYQFCLEIDNNFEKPGAEHVECVTYTTCELCGESSIDFNYLGCPVGEGCNLAFSTNIEALNMIGVKSTTKYVIRYQPTANEALAGVQAYDVKEIPVDLSFVPGEQIIDFSEDINVKYRRGCYEIRVEFELEDDYAPHFVKDGPICNRFDLFDDQTFQCIACNDPMNECLASKYATKISNEEGVCLPLSCPYAKSSESDAGYIKTQKLLPFIYPNPATDYVRFQYSGPVHDNMTIQLFNARGELLHVMDFQTVSANGLNVSDFLPGMYLLVLREQGEIVRTEKLMIN